ncbi:MAG: hypothetical protein QXP06_07450 [Candidatus Bathyarchaeia archaeon]
MSKKVHVAIEYDTWKKLATLKLIKEKKTFDDVVKMLLENFEAKENVGKGGTPSKD